MAENEIEERKERVLDRRERLEQLKREHRRDRNKGAQSQLTSTRRRVRVKLRR